MRLAALALAITVIGPASAAASPACRPGSAPMAKVELYFGAGTPHNAARWRHFLAAVVTPLFPDGLTVIDGYGQSRGAGDRLDREPTRILVILYAPGPGTDAHIETIRRAYVRQFRQRSVLRVDTPACVSF